MLSLPGGMVRMNFCFGRKQISANSAVTSQAESGLARSHRPQGVVP